MAYGVTCSLRLRSCGRACGHAPGGIIAITLKADESLKVWDIIVSMLAVILRQTLAT
jgi:hypothetical protein